MPRLLKPARGKHFYRGLFSYLTESVINMTNYVNVYGIQDIKYYHDLVDIPGYVNGNLFDVILQQDVDDFHQYKHEYTNIEDTRNLLNLDCYKHNFFTEDIRIKTEFVVNEFFKPNQELSLLLQERHKEINFSTTVGVHRRATDISQHHQIVSLDNLFHNIETENFDYIFLMCDNQNDMVEFKKRYGNKLITYDDFTSDDYKTPYFKLKNKETEDIRKHVFELMFGVLTLSKTKKFFCTLSNISTFTIFSNSKLNYKLLF